MGKRIPVFGKTDHFERSGFDRLYFDSDTTQINSQLLPDENKEEEAKLLPNTSFVVVKNSICSTSRLFPADRIIYFSYQPSTFLKVRI
jgi:hypothetical protein